MYYKKYSEIPSLPKELADECVFIAEHNVKNNVPMVVFYGRYETENKNSAAYNDPGKEYLETGGEQSGGVGFFDIPSRLNLDICNFYKSVNHPLIKNEKYFIQVCTGGKFVGPHVDDSNSRAEGFLYLIKSGGSDVRTRWYELKEEYSHLSLTEYSVIPYSRLNIVEDHRLEENTWHWLNFNKIHSVENQETLRVALWGHE